MKHFIAVLFLLCAVTAQAQYPNRPVKLVVPFTPGTGIDILGDAEVRAGLLKQGLSVRLGSPAELSKLIESDLERWGRVVRDARISAD